MKHRLNTSTTANSASTYVGRVGRLAAVLGVGAVVAMLGQGVASADTDASSGSSSSSQRPSSDSSEGAGSAPKPVSPKSATHSDDTAAGGRTSTDSPSESAPSPSESGTATSGTGTAAPGVTVSTGGAQHGSITSSNADSSPSKHFTPKTRRPPADTSSSSTSTSTKPTDGEKGATDKTGTAPKGSSPTTSLEPASAPSDAVEAVTVPVAIEPQPPAPTVPSTAADPAKVVAAAVTSLTSTLAAASTGTTPPDPTTPTDPLTTAPAAVADAVLAASARRELATAPSPVASAATDTPAADASTPATPEAASVAATTVAATAPTTPVTFTGQPSLVNQLFVTALSIFNPILKAFGIDITDIPLSIPFFTDGVPDFFLTYGLNVSSSDYNGWKVWTLAPPNPTGQAVVAIHGGGFISQVSVFHWLTYTDMARDTGATVIVPLYPLANDSGPGGATASTVVPQMSDFIASVSETYGAANTSVIGDSAGGTIALAAVQQLVLQCGADLACRSKKIPGHMVLFAPALDLSYADPALALVTDPLLDVNAARKHGIIWAGDLSVTDPLVSPIYGSMEGLPPTTVIDGSLDTQAVYVTKLQQQVIAHNTADPTNPDNINFVLRTGEIHDWFIFGFLPDAYTIRPDVYDGLGLTNADTI